MFGMGSVDSLLRLGVAHCFLCVVLTFCHVSVSHTVWYALSVTVCHVSTFRTVLYVFCLIFCDLSVLHTIFNVFCWIV